MGFSYIKDTAEYFGVSQDLASAFVEDLPVNLGVTLHMDLSLGQIGFQAAYCVLWAFVSLGDDYLIGFPSLQQLFEP